jgi:hypothetical protein
VSEAAVAMLMYTIRSDKEENIKKFYKKKQWRPPSKKKKRGKNPSPRNRKGCHIIRRKTNYYLIISILKTLTTDDEFMIYRLLNYAGFRVFPVGAHVVIILVILFLYNR